MSTLEARGDLGPAPVSQVELEHVRRSMRRALFSSSDTRHRIGRYELTDLLGAALHSEIFAAYDTHLQRTVALKLVPIDDHGGEDQLREARLLAGLAHPRVVTVFDAGVASRAETGDNFDRVYLSMELLDGPTLGRWLSTERPTWREILRVFIAAGEGLVAAHEAGVCHGDFKPDNVVLAPQGAKLVDFGLARRLPDPVDARSLAGTPAFMAPEQHRGDPPTTLSDQYAFCVALYESLAGQPAFEADTLSQLVANKERGAPGGLRSRRIPAGVWRSIVRGLDPDPARRHPELRQLLRALERSVRRRTGLVATLVASPLLLAAVAVAPDATTASPTAAPCPEPEALFDAVYDGSDRAALARVFARSTVADSTTIGRRALDRMDDWGERWRSERTQVCSMPEPERTARGLCLDQQLTALSEVVGHLSTKDPRRVRDAVAATGALPNPGGCTDPPESNLSGDPRTDRILMRVSTLYDLGRYEDALALVEPLAEALFVGEQSASRAEQARVMLALGQARAKNDDPLGATEALRHAASLAEAAGDDPQAAMALIRLAWVVGELRAQTAEATTLLSVAEGKLEGLGTVPALWAELETMRGHVTTRQDPVAALSHYRSALEHQRAAHGPSDRRVGEALVNLGNALDDNNQPEQARAVLTEAIALWRSLLGPVHPLTAAAYHGIGLTYLKRGRPDLAFVHLQAAYDQSVASEGPDASSTHRYAALLGAVMVELGAVDEGRAMMVDAREDLAKLAGSEHAEVVRMRINLARSHLLHGDVERAHQELAAHLEAIEAPLARQPVLADAWAMAATIAFRAGDDVRAAELAEQALELRRSLHQGPILVAEAQLALGQALERADPDRAIELVADARDTLIAQRASPSLIEAATAWLAAHRS